MSSKVTHWIVALFVAAALCVVGQNVVAQSSPVAAVAGLGFAVEPVVPDLSLEWQADSTEADLVMAWPITYPIGLGQKSDDLEDPAAYADYKWGVVSPFVEFQYLPDNNQGRALGGAQFHYTPLKLGKTVAAGPRVEAAGLVDLDGLGWMGGAGLSVVNYRDTSGTNGVLAGSVVYRQLRISDLETIHAMTLDFQWSMFPLMFNAF